MRHLPGRFQPARAAGCPTSARMARNTARHAAPRDPRLLRALHRHPDRELRRQAALLAGAAAGGRRLHRVGGRPLRARGRRDPERRAGLRAEADIRNEKINYKVREHSVGKVPVILAVGRKEVEDGTVTVRRLGEKQTQVMPLDALVAELAAEAKAGFSVPDLPANPPARRKSDAPLVLRNRLRLRQPRPSARPIPPAPARATCCWRCAQPRSTTGTSWSCAASTGGACSHRSSRSRTALAPWSRPARRHRPQAPATAWRPPSSRTGRAAHRPPDLEAGRLGGPLHGVLATHRVFPRAGCAACPRSPDRRRGRDAALRGCHRLECDHRRRPGPSR
jgi:hypothetical protein